MVSIFRNIYYFVYVIYNIYISYMLYSNVRNIYILTIYSWNIPCERKLINYVESLELIPIDDRSALNEQAFGSLFSPTSHLSQSLIRSVSYFLFLETR